MMENTESSVPQTGLPGNAPALAAVAAEDHIGGFTSHEEDAGKRVASQNAAGESRAKAAVLALLGLV